MINTLKTAGLRGLSSIATLGFTFLATNLYGLKEVGSFAVFLSLSSFIFFIIKFGMEIPLFVDLTKDNSDYKIKIVNEYKNLQNIIFLLFTFVFLPVSTFAVTCIPGIIGRDLPLYIK